MTGIFGYRPTPTLDIPPFINILTPPEIFAVVYWMVLGYAARNLEPALTVLGFTLGLISGIKYTYNIPRYWRPPVPTGPV